MKNPLFRRYFLPTLILGSVFGLIAVLINVLNIYILRSRMGDRPMPPWGHRPAALHQHILETVEPAERVTFLSQLEERQDSMGWTVILADENRSILYPPEMKGQILSEEKIQNFPKFPGPRGLRGQPEVAPLKGEPRQYLAVGPPSWRWKGLKGSGFEKMRPPDPKHMFFLLAAVVFGAVAIGVIGAIFFFFYSISRRAREVDWVLQELKNGNLGARVSVKKIDEFGPGTARINSMAEEIEKLVNRLKDVQNTRTQLFQSLTHDLRTPVASLKHSMEMLAIDGQRLREDQKAELTEIGLKELEYLEVLLEELLTLAQVTEADYMVNKAEVDLVSAMNQAIETTAFNFRVEDTEIEFSPPPKMVKVIGDKHLLIRLFRNALENAVNYGQQKVSVVMGRLDGGQVFVEISNDGHGLSPEGLESFGKRRISRKLSRGKDGKVSLGLGSFIISEVIRVHRGEFEIANLKDAQGSIIGAKLRLSLESVPNDLA